MKPMDKFYQKRLYGRGLGIIPTFIHKIYLCIFLNFMNIFIFNPYY